ncbi:hypothetical protein A7E78_05195 [Syntrophotalea acetylenivorans]|uniref:Uncharacterized protein n=1 Tax=Syntrophotalea acetylenivorans TaxID=1842532 RepID=A0A1L3GNN4_9BACT|nr:hypothetical protein [Syntrophotalea acetylenivorans]APG27288.1 hypothetical protein A7E78_05195 [Syntrophotalea acetylenivorans]
MIVLCLEQEVAASPYFVIHHQEESWSGAPTRVVSGILGDGWYEGEVAVEVGDRQGVTFADEWFDRAGLQAFFDRVGRDQVCAALYQALDSPERKSPFGGETEPKPTVPHYAANAGHGLIASGEPCWRAVA